VPRLSRAVCEFRTEGDVVCVTSATFLLTSIAGRRAHGEAERPQTIVAALDCLTFFSRRR
jgi:hypothetical protein